MDPFAAALGPGRGLAPGQRSSVTTLVVTEEMLDRGAQALAEVSTMEAEFLREETRTILLAGSVAEADRRLREMCGTPDEDYTAYAEAVLDVVTAQTN